MRGVPPYLVPEPGEPAWAAWHVDLGTGSEPLPSFLPDWDTNTDLHLARTVEIDIERVKLQAGLPEGAAFMLVVEWFTSGARVGGLAARTEVAHSGPCSLSIKLSGEGLSGSLSITTRLVLAVDLASPSFTAARIGEVLLEDVATTRLHGAAGRMPTYVVDFAQAGFDADARWNLHLSHDLTVPVLAGLRLYLNSRDKELVTAAENAGRPTHMQRRLLEWLEIDVASQLAEHAVDHDRRNHVADHLGEVDTLGGSLAGLLATLFPGESPTTLGALRDNDPGLFRARTQGAVRRMRSNHDDALPTAL